ncbi:Endocuticle structural glycoprotein SgAbd-2 [Eufriesea mexicana]|uniref:Endocuticle structural glycoprotein SgAbd-2 n=1 Tax=Eufriesea mexicana TaxID=516756 RepID=A0A310SI56_9HYME|nr:Endocuticle structural glycoprotein SgAbd-2 [Eufriesea mexicana]
MRIRVTPLKVPLPLCHYPPVSVCPGLASLSVAVSSCPMCVLLGARWLSLLSQTIVLVMPPGVYIRRALRGLINTCPSAITAAACTRHWRSYVKQLAISPFVPAALLSRENPASQATRNRKKLIRSPVSGVDRTTPTTVSDSINSTTTTLEYTRPYPRNANLHTYCHSNSFHFLQTNILAVNTVKGWNVLKEKGNGRKSQRPSDLPQVAVIALASCVAAAPADDVIPIVSQSQEGPNPDGSYKWNYETGNGIKAQEEGHVENAGSENEAMNAQGSFSYRSDDGQEISLTYVANEEGFQPQGAHLPTTPEIPQLIKNALEWIAAHPSKEDQNQV